MANRKSPIALTSEPRATKVTRRTAVRVRSEPPKEILTIYCRSTILCTPEERVRLKKKHYDDQPVVMVTIADHDSDLGDFHQNENDGSSDDTQPMHFYMREVASGVVIWMNHVEFWFPFSRVLAIRSLFEFEEEEGDPEIWAERGCNGNCRPCKQERQKREEQERQKRETRECIGKLIPSSIRHA